MINSEAMKKIYKTMKNRPNDTTQPKDLGREWHSDSQSGILGRKSVRSLISHRSVRKLPVGLQLFADAGHASCGWGYLMVFRLRAVSLASASRGWL